MFNANRKKQNWFYIEKFFFGYAVSSLLCRLFPGDREQRILSSCSARASPCNGFSCCHGQTPGPVDFSSCSTWVQWLWLPGSGAQAP